MDDAIMAAALKPAPAPKTARLVEAAGATIDADDDQWRRLGGDNRRDLQPMAQSRMIELASWLWQSNRLANRIVELPVAYLLAEGVSLEVDDEEAAAWLKAFWHDPINRLDKKLEAKMRALSLFGEQFWPVFVRADGHIRLGYLDPACVEKVIVDPDNGEQPIVVSARTVSGRRRLYQVIVAGGDEDDLFPPGTDARALRDAATDGQLFYFRINDLPNSTRGRSDLLSAIDWCDAYETFLFGELDRAIISRSGVWDVSLRGATAEQVAERAAKIQPPKPGGVRVHNDAEIWTALAPDLGAYDADTAARMIRVHVLGGSSIPEHFFGSGGDVNRATAGAMGDPFEKTLTLRQGFWKAVLEEVASFVIGQKRAALGRDGAEPDDPAFRPRAVFPELVSEDVSRYAAALGQVSGAAFTCIDRGVLSEETALSIIALVAARLGVAINPKDELEKAKEDAATREADAYGSPDLAGDADAPPAG
jgi:hypothetical protein